MTDLREVLTQLADEATSGTTLDRPDQRGALPRRGPVVPLLLALVVTALVAVGIVRLTDREATQVQSTPSAEQPSSTTASTPPNDPRVSLLVSTDTARPGDVIRLTVQAPKDLVWGQEIIWQRWEGSWRTQMSLAGPAGDESARTHVVGGVDDIGYFGDSFQMVVIPPSEPGQYRLMKQFIQGDEGRPIEERKTVAVAELAIVE